MNPSKRIAMAVLASAAVAMAPTAASAAVAPTSVAPAASATSIRPVTTYVTAADLRTDTSTTAQPGEGVIRITTRICGNADSWLTVADDNGILAPVYLVLLGQKLTVTCTPGSATAPAAPAPAPPAVVANTGWVAPVSACIVSGFGPRWGTMHQGVDLAAGYGTPIKAASAGTVSVGYQANGAGNYSMINHGNGNWTVYMHQSSYQVTSGWVDAGQTIGYVGQTGDAQGPHLHFEVHLNGLWNTRVDPVPFMADRGVYLGC